MGIIIANFKSWRCISGELWNFNSVGIIGFYHRVNVFGMPVFD